MQSVRLKALLESAGQLEFQRVVTSIMLAVDPEFRHLQLDAPDRGNDGFVPHGGKYFQIHASYGHPDIAGAAKKLKDDAAKLRSNWSPRFPMTGYVFVFKASNGVPSALWDAAAEVRSHDLAVDVWDNQILMHKAALIPEWALVPIAGPKTILRDDRNAVSKFLAALGEACGNLDGLAHWDPIFTTRAQLGVQSGLSNLPKVRESWSDDPAIQLHQVSLINVIAEIKNLLQRNAPLLTYTGAGRIDLDPPYSPHTGANQILVEVNALKLRLATHLGELRRYARAPSD